MYAIYLIFWKFSGCWGRNETWTKNSLSGHVNVFQILTKITDFDIWKGFGGGLEHPNIWIFDHLNR